MDKKINIIYQDSDILVINKPAGLVVESQSKDKISQTLEGILEKDFKINLPRGGIVHRLDKDTSGLMVIAKNEKALVNLQTQFAGKQVKKIYYALVLGKLKPEKGTIKLALRRDPTNRTRFVGSKSKEAREAVTRYEVVGYKKFQIANNKLQTNIKSQISNDKKEKNILSFTKVFLETGRTHQIRAHFFAIGYPIIGDQVYKNAQSKAVSEKLGLNRQFLHAGKLSFKHPVAGKMVSFKTDLPEDLKKII